MRRIGWVVPVLVLLACSRRAPVPAPPWSDGEVTEYVVFVGGDSAGVARYVITRDEYEGEPAYRISGVDKFVYKGTEISDSHDVYLRVSDLRPMYSDRTVRGWMNVRSTATYLENKGQRGAKIWKVSLDDGSESEATVGVGETAQDGNVVFQVMRTIDYTRENGGVFTSFVAVQAMEVAVRWNLLGEETQLGTPCYKVGMNIGGRGIYLWIEKAEPHRIVRKDDLTANVVMKLSPHP